MAQNLRLDGHKLNYHPGRVADFLEGREVWPLYAEISPTSVCNHRCRFCNFNYLGHEGRRLPDGRMQTLVEELKNGGVKAVVFAGAGEPSLHPDTFAAIRRAVELGLDAATSTNGALLSEEQLAEMAELLTWTRFSINGGTPEAYANSQGANSADLEKALNSVHRLARQRAQRGSTVTIGSQCVLIPENKDSIIPLARRLKDSGADYFSVKHFYPHTDNAYRPDMSFLTPEFLRELREEAATLSDDNFTMIVRDIGNLDRNRSYAKCLGLPFIIYVREDGMLYTCFSHQDDPRTAIGNINERDFASVWSSSEKTRAINYINDHFDKNLCQANCRHHQINSWLHELQLPPEHVNFI